jgi:hypothetical protein
VEKLSKPREDKEVSSLRRSMFLKKVMETEGKFLLDYLEVGVDGCQRYPCRAVFAHIKSKANVTLNRMQTSLLKQYLKALGIETLRTSKVDYFTNLKLKD